MLNQEEVKEMLAANEHAKSVVDAMGDSIALQGYNPKGVSKQNMFA